MRWFGPAAVALLLTCGTAAAATPAGQSSSASKNLLLNPGFEKGLSDHLWMPAAWDTFQSGLNTVFFGRDTLLRHSGRYSVSIANLSSYVPMFHNWSQSLVVGRELWGKDVVFTVWTHSDGLQGRAYVLLQAYRDTITKMSKIWKIDRESARERLRILKSDDPLVTLGWSRDYFSAPETDWVKREVRIFVPPSANVVVVRCGIFGVGQVTFDDASLVAQAARTPEAMPLQTNLFKDPGFEGSGDDWEYSMPPYEGLEIARDSTVAHSGRASIRMDGGVTGPVQVRTGVCQSVANRGLVGKRLRLSGWVEDRQPPGQRLHHGVLLDGQRRRLRRDAGAVRHEHGLDQDPDRVRRATRHPDGLGLVLLQLPSAGPRVLRRRVARDPRARQLRPERHSASRAQDAGPLTGCDHRGGAHRCRGGPLSSTLDSSAQPDTCWVCSWAERTPWQGAFGLVTRSRRCRDPAEGPTARFHERGAPPDGSTGRAETGAAWCVETLAHSGSVLRTCSEGSPSMIPPHPCIDRVFE